MAEIKLSRTIGLTYMGTFASAVNYKELLLPVANADSVVVECVSDSVCWKHEGRILETSIHVHRTSFAMWNDLVPYIRPSFV